MATQPLFDMSKATPIQGQAPLFDMSKATPIGGQSTQTAPAKQPSTWQVLTQPTDKTDKEYLGYTGPAGVAGATIKGLDDVGRGVQSSLGGMWNTIRHPIDTAKSIAQLPSQAAQIPAAIHDINQSPDPLSHYADAAQDTVSQGAGQALTGIAAAALPRIISRIIPSAATRGALAQKIVGPLTYENAGEAAADLRSGAVPERGLVNEGLVGTKQGLVNKADVRLGQLKTAANNILDNHPNSGQIINAEPMIDGAIDDAVNQANKTGAPTTRLENLRQALKTQYGNIQGTPRQMNDLKTSIQDTARQLGAYKNTQPVEASAANAMSDAAARIKNAVNQRVPEAAELNQRMQDLKDAREGIQKKVNQARGDDLFKETASNASGTVGKIAQRTIGSAPVRTGVARFLNMGNVQDVPSPMSPPIRPPIRGLLRSVPTPLGPSTATNPLSAPPLVYPFRGVGNSSQLLLGNGPVELGPSGMTNPLSPAPAYDLATTPLRKGRLLPSATPTLPEPGYTSPAGEPIGTPNPEPVRMPARVLKKAKR